MINSPEATARGVARLERVIAVSALLAAERTTLLELLRLLGAATSLCGSRPAPTRRRGRRGVLVSLLDAYHREVGRLGS
jgi:hypothetical protein